MEMSKSNIPNQYEGSRLVVLNKDGEGAKTKSKRNRPMSNPNKNGGGNKVGCENRQKLTQVQFKAKKEKPMKVTQPVKQVTRKKNMIIPNGTVNRTKKGIRNMQGGTRNLDKVPREIEKDKSNEHSRKELDLILAYQKLGVSFMVRQEMYNGVVFPNVEMVDFLKKTRITYHSKDDLLQFL